MNNTPEDVVKEARELLSKATPGPWKTFMQSGPLVAAMPGGQRVYSAGASPMDKVDHEANANLTAAAPELLASLCDEVERLRLERNDLRSQVEQHNYMSMFSDTHVGED